MMWGMKCRAKPGNTGEKKRLADVHLYTGGERSGMGCNPNASKAGQGAKVWWYEAQLDSTRFLQSKSGKIK